MFSPEKMHYCHQRNSAQIFYYIILHCRFDKVELVRELSSQYILHIVVLTQIVKKPERPNNNLYLKQLGLIAVIIQWLIDEHNNFK